MTVKSSVFTSWKTTLAGLIIAIGLIGPQINNVLDNDPATTCNWMIVIAGLGSAFGGAAARDNNKSSEDAGVK